MTDTEREAEIARLSAEINRVHFGDCLATLRQMPDGIVNTCVTSPPYFGLRDYGHAGQIGLEPTPDEFIAKLVDVFREVRRVLRDDGTLWLNLGDSYSNGGRKTRDTDDKLGARGMNMRPNDGAKPKDLLGIPWRVAFALQADGWYLRQDIIWSKPNAMPESVTDRCTKAHEYIFLLAKSERYYFDHEAIKEPASPDTHARYSRGRSDKHKHAQASLVPGAKPQTIAQGFQHMRKPVAGWQSGPGSHSAIEHAQELEGCQRKLLNNGVGWGHGTDAEKRERGRVRKLANANSGTKNNESFDAAMAVMPADRAKRSVWTVATKSYSGAHFATFPPELIEPCILAGAPAGGVVLDPFFGSGTTGEVSQRLGRNWIGCELNPDYKPLQDERLRQPGLVLQEAA